MHIRTSTFAIATIVVTTLALPISVIHGQEAKPSPTPAPKPDTDFWTQEQMTGDWGGARSRMEARGVEMEFELTGFAQGIATGGTDTGSVGIGKFQAGLEYWFADVRTETRFGGPLLLGTGSLNPVNTTAIIPAASGDVFAISALNITKLFPINLKEGNLIAVSLGRYNMVDLIDEEFFAGRGIDRFFNLAQIGPLTVWRQVPVITNAVSFAYIRRGEPFFTFALLDPNDHSTNPGLSDLFTDGVTFAPGIRFQSKFFGKSGVHSIGGAVTTKRYTPFDSIRQVIIPGPPIRPIEPEPGSFSVNYTFQQYLVERARDDGWGLFAQASIADQRTSPITRFLDVGLGGNGLFASRPRDEFGIAYAYTDLSSVLKDNLAPLGFRRLRAEHQVEMFYNFHITPWLRLTGDLQFLRPNRPVSGTVIVPGARLEVVF